MICPKLKTSFLKNSSPLTLEEKVKVLLMAEKNLTDSEDDLKGSQLVSALIPDGIGSIDMS